MSSTVTFDEAVDAVSQLPVDQQEDLLGVVSRRLAARGRGRVVADVSDARRAHADGQTRPGSVGEIMREITR